MNTKTKLTALATSTLLLVGIAGPAKADTQETPKDVAPITESVPITAPAVKLQYECPTVKTTPAPEPQPVAVQQA